jgi:hypothetical protein
MWNILSQLPIFALVFSPGASAPSGAQVILGPNSLIQAALPAIFEHTPPEYYSELNAQLEAQAACVCAQLQVRWSECGAITATENPAIDCNDHSILFSNNKSANMRVKSISKQIAVFTGKMWRIVCTQPQYHDRLFISD